MARKEYCTLNTDASVKGNLGGYAIWITTNRGRIRKYGRFKIPVNDSNKAEIMAVINGIHLILANNICVDTLVVNTDNAFCRDVVNKKQKGSSNQDLAQLSIQLLEFCSNFNMVYAKSIKGHTKLKTTRHYVNRWCDEHARKGRLGIFEE